MVNKVDGLECGNRIIIIDGHNFLWRAFSVPFQFHSATGTPLQVISTYLKLIRRSLCVIENLSAKDSLIVVFDSEGETENSTLSSEYKTNRRIFSDEEDCPYKHIPNIKKTLNDLNIFHLAVPSLEADDIIATIAENFKNQSQSNEVYIVSSDTDFYQLLDDRTFMVKLKSGEEHEIIDTRHLEDKLGISPNEYIYFKSLTGDSADNIKGIQGVGPKTARKIIRKEVLFEDLKHRETLDLNEKLISLKCNLDLGIDLKSMIYRSEILEKKNVEIFESCGF